MWVMQDHQGSTRAMLNSAGQVVGRHDPLAFGDTAGEGNEVGPQAPEDETTGLHGWWNTVRHLYAGLERDAATGLEHATFRKYEPWAGRWTSPDPYLGSMNPADPQSFNRYAYVQNDPVNFVDPRGLNAVSPGTTFGGGILWTRWYGNNNDGWRLVNQWFEPHPGAGVDPDGTQNPQNPAPTQQGRLSEEECNKKLASIFGGPGSPVSTVNEPSGIDPNYAGDNRIHHLANNGVLHIYGNAQGTTTDAPLYRPPGGTFLRRGSGEYEEKIDGVGTGNYSNVFQFSYSGGLVIKFFHVGGTSGGVEGGARLGRYPGQTNAAGSLRIGNIGGLGGTGDRYNHSHIEFRVNGRRTDPRKIYCGY